MNNNAIKHIFFDLDNTLWDFEKNSREALLHLFNEHHIKTHCKTEFEDFIEIYETVNHELWHLYNLHQITKEELRYQRFYKSFLHFNYNNLQLAHFWADEYLKISPYKTHLIDGAMDILLYLKDKYQLHIITNGFKEVQYTKLNYSQLAPFFEYVVISEEYGYNKPDIKIFDIAKVLTSSKKNECVMIGDNYDTDILGALNANWKAIYLSNQHKTNEDKNYFQIDKLIQLKEHL